MIRGIIRPNGYQSHHHGNLSFHAEAPREFIVDEQAERVIDEPPLGHKKGETLQEYSGRLKGKPLVLTPSAYAELMKKNGGPIVFEIIGGAHEDRIAMLERELRLAGTEIDRRGDALAEQRQKNEELSTCMADLQRALAEANAKVERLSTASSNAEIDRLSSIAEERARRVADLEQQLAAAKAAAPSGVETKQKKTAQG